MNVSYHRLLLHPRLLAPMRLALVARTARAAPGWRLDVWEYEGGALKSRTLKHGVQE